MAFSIFLILCIFYFSTCVFPDPRRARMRLLMRVMSPVTEERKGFISTRLLEGAEPPRELCQHLEDAYNFKTALFFLYIYFFKSWDRGGVGNCSLSENRRHGRSWSCQAPAFSRKSLDLACTEKQNYSSVNLVFCMFCALKCNCFENKTNLVMWC